MHNETKNENTNEATRSFFSLVTFGWFDPETLTPEENARWKQKCEIHFPKTYEAAASKPTAILNKRLINSQTNTMVI